MTGSEWALKAIPVLVKLLEKAWEWWWRPAASTEPLKEQVLGRLHAEERRLTATQAIFQPEHIAQCTGMGLRRLRPILCELEQEKRIFRDRLVTMGYSLRPLPWDTMRLYGWR